MPALPPQLASHVFANLFDVYSLLCCEVGESGRVENVWGDAEPYGLMDMEIGIRVQDLPFLMGMPLNESWVIESTETVSGHHCDIHFTPDLGDKNYLVFVPTGTKVIRHRENQQRSHELEILQKQNAKLIERLQHSKDMLEKESAMKSKFIAGMSHEFRTPLTSVLGYTQLLAEIPQMTPESHAHLIAVERSAQHLLSLVENLLDQAQIETNNFKLKPSNISLETMMEEVSAIIAPLAASKGLAFHAQLSPNCERYAFLDGVGMRQVAINILGNAVKFTDEGEISFMLEQVGENLVFTITDTGPGIPESEYKKIFTAFGRINKKSTIPGVGLGLNISARLVELMQGSIDIDSTVGEGTSFIVAVPFQRADKHYVLQQTQQILLPKKKEKEGVKRLLLAEDNPDISQLLSILLKRSGFEVTVASNGRIALDAMAKKEYDAVVTDLMMPEMTGQELVQKLRRKGYENPILALTASQKKGELVQMRRLGFTEILSKPIQLPELLMALNKHLS